MSVRPFSCGTEALDWTARNCDRCAKSERSDHDGPITPTCDIERALGEAFFTGVVSDDIAKRMGRLDRAVTDLTWDCPERQPRP